MVPKEELEAWRSRWERARATGGEEERERMAEEVERDLVFLGVTAVEDELQVTCFIYICFCFRHFSHDPREYFCLGQRRTCNVSLAFCRTKSLASIW